MIFKISLSLSLYHFNNPETNVLLCCIKHKSSLPLGIEKRPMILKIPKLGLFRQAFRYYLNRLYISVIL